MILNSLKKDFSFAYAGNGGGWILSVAGSEYSRLASIDERQALDAYYEALPKLRKMKCQGLPYIMF